MSDKDPTPDQRDVILTIDRHVLVAAGAGSGKTSTVIRRLLYLLGVPVDGQTIPTPVPLDRLSAITFTLAAAAELKRKLRTGLLEAGQPRMAHRVDTARIGTIHAFCGDVLREFALRRGVSPSVGVLEEGAARALAEEAARDALVEAVEARQRDVAEMLTRRQQSDVHKAILQLLDQGDRLRRFDKAKLPKEERALVRVAVAALALLEARLRERGGMDFDRMLTWTRDLLRDDGYARRTLQRRIHTLIVDEFQDVDPVQWEIARLVGDPESGRADTPRLLLVGDPKQSIYRFRNADVTTWRAAEALFDAGAGRVIPLNENFRSTAPILDFVAATAGVLLDRSIDPAAGRQPFEIKFARLKPGKPAQADGPPVELIAIPPVGGTIGRIRRYEAEAIATRAVALHGEGVAWRDMALLLPAWTSAELYQDALRRQGVPTYLLLDQGFFERREVLDQILALEVIRDPGDDRALMGFLRSPFVGLRDETLLAIATQTGRPYWPKLERVAGFEVDKLRRGIDLLRWAVTLRDRIPTDALLGEVLERSGYWAHLALLGAAREQAVANVRKFLLQARGAAESSVGEFLRGIAAQREREDRVGDARLHGAHDDVVTLSTVHSAKGLEWEVVFWCDLLRDGGGPHQKILIGRETVALKDPHAAAQGPAWLAIEAEQEREDAAEKKRLWYVASTRAKRRLIVSPFPAADYKRADSTPVGTLRDLLSMAPGDTTATYPKNDGGVWQASGRLSDAVPPEQPQVRPALPVHDPSVLPAPLESIGVPAGRQLHSATEALALSRCETKHWFQYVMGLREPAMRRDTPEFGGAVARGQIVHDVLEQYRLEAELDGLIDDAVQKWDPDAPPPETDEGAGYRKQLRAEVELVAKHPAYREVADLPGARRELGFIHLTGPGNGWQGGFDLAAPGPGGWVLLDVKTGGDSDVDLKARQYGPQRDVYARAAEAIAGEPVKEFRFHFSRAGKQVRHAFDEVERAALPPQLKELADRMESGTPRLTNHPAECGHCGFKRVAWCKGAVP